MKLPSAVLESMRVGVAGAGILLAMGCHQPDPSRDLSPVLANAPAGDPSEAISTVAAISAPAPVAVVAPPVVAPPVVSTLPSVPVAASAVASQLLAQKRAERARALRAQQALMNSRVYVACGMG